MSSPFGSTMLVTSMANLLGGELFPAPIVVWWNLVAAPAPRSTPPHASWGTAQDDRFGRFRSTLPRIPATAPYWQRTGENR
ncbi:hypothetical protein [Streptomyces deserti]